MCCPEWKLLAQVTVECLEPGWCSTPAEGAGVQIAPCGPGLGHCTCAMGALACEEHGALRWLLTCFSSILASVVSRPSRSRFRSLSSHSSFAWWHSVRWLCPPPPATHTRRVSGSPAPSWTSLHVSGTPQHILSSLAPVGRKVPAGGRAQGPTRTPKSLTKKATVHMSWAATPFVVHVRVHERDLWAGNKR